MSGAGRQGDIPCQPPPANLLQGRCANLLQWQTGMRILCGSSGRRAVGGAGLICRVHACQAAGCRLQGFLEWHTAQASPAPARQQYCTSEPQALGMQGCVCVPAGMWGCRDMGRHGCPANTPHTTISMRSLLHPCPPVMDAFLLGTPEMELSHLVPSPPRHYHALNPCPAVSDYIIRHAHCNVVSHKDAAGIKAAAAAGAGPSGGAAR